MCNNEFGNDETHCNTDALYVPSDGWWCRDCGVFRSVDDGDVCAECRQAVRVTGRIVSTMHGSRSHD